MPDRENSSGPIDFTETPCVGQTGLMFLDADRYELRAAVMGLCVFQV